VHAVLEVVVVTACVALVMVVVFVAVVERSFAFGAMNVRV